LKTPQKERDQLRELVNHQDITFNNYNGLPTPRDQYSQYQSVPQTPQFSLGQPNFSKKAGANLQNYPQ
jgi:hypothetical protein